MVLGREKKLLGVIGVLERERGLMFYGVCGGPYGWVLGLVGGIG